MAKDPAFLFYPGDWLQGTMGMTFEERGAYLELLIFQFNNGKFSKAQARQVLSICSASVFENVLQKFNNDGVFFWKQRLTDEIERRKRFTESRRNNAKSKKSEPKTEKAYAKHMETVTENEIEKKNKKESGDFYEVDVPGDEVLFPIDTPSMRQLWAAWKEARWANYGISYGMHGEQAALKQLEGMNFHEAKAAIQQAIAGKWKNLYPEKNGKRKSLNDSKSRIDEIVKHRFGTEGAG